jgi:DNA (cytosine-5)-methyltransferase 1
MRHGSLFSGIGGFDLAAQWMGWTNVFHVERDDFCREVLRHHFPNSEPHEDIKSFDATAYAGRVDIISGGFPCQPFSAAGNRRGMSDDRYLWPEMFRVIREARPSYVVAENVRGLLSWNDGLVLDTVCSDLEGEGYEVFPVVLPAASVANCPHRRDRIWIIAYRDDGLGEQSNEEVQPRGDASNDGRADATNTGGMGRQRRGGEEAEGREGERLRVQPDSEGQGSGADATNANGAGARQDYGQGKPGQPHQTRAPIDWQDFPTVAPICGGDDGLPTRLDGITFPKWRRESIKAYGNAIVPQVALQIFRSLE